MQPIAFVKPEGCSRAQLEKEARGSGIKIGKIKSQTDSMRTATLTFIFTNGRAATSDADRIFPEAFIGPKFLSGADIRSVTHYGLRQRQSGNFGALHWSYVYGQHTAAMSRNIRGTA